MPNVYTLLPLFLLLSTSAAKNQDDHDRQDLIQSSCMHASYPNLCLRTLSSYTGPAKTPRDLAQAAVLVSQARARNLQGYLSQLTASTKKEKQALNDCAEQISDSVDELGKTLNELKHLSRSEQSFQWQMSNAQTWVSAALTNEDTCLDGFKDVESKVKSEVKRKITNVAKVTSNALYMINLLDQSYGRRA